jgi:hypothetical protein
VPFAADGVLIVQDADRVGGSSIDWPEAAVRTAPPEDPPCTGLKTLKSGTNSRCLLMRRDLTLRT